MGSSADIQLIPARSQGHPGLGEHHVVHLELDGLGSLVIADGHEGPGPHDGRHGSQNLGRGAAEGRPAVTLAPVVDVQAAVETPVVMAEDGLDGCAPTLPDPPAHGQLGEFVGVDVQGEGDVVERPR